MCLSSVKWLKLKRERRIGLSRSFSLSLSLSINLFTLKFSVHNKIITLPRNLFDKSIALPIYRPSSGDLTRIYRELTRKKNQQTLPFKHNKIDLLTGAGGAISSGKNFLAQFFRTFSTYSSYPFNLLIQQTHQVLALRLSIFTRSNFTVIDSLAFN